MFQISPIGCFFLSLPIMSMYLNMYYSIATRTAWWPYLMCGATVATLAMFLYVVRVEEKATLTFFHRDTGRTYGSGTYFMPNLFPFLREIDFTFGFALVVSRRSRAREVHHYIDQRRPRYEVRVNANSLMQANFDRLSNNFFAWLTNFHGRDGEVEYFRVGRLLFAILVVAAFVGGLVAPNKNKEETSLFSAISFPRIPSFRAIEGQGLKTSQERLVTVNLREDKLPPLPPREKFETVTKEARTWFFYEYEGKKYFLYRTPSGNEIPMFVVKEPVCVITPAGKSIWLLSSLAPRVALNMQDDVTYFKSPRNTSLTNRWTRAVFSPEIPTDQSYELATGWQDLYKNWGTIDKTLPFLAETLPYSGTPPEMPGGLVCF